MWESCRVSSLAKIRIQWPLYEPVFILRMGLELLVLFVVECTYLKEPSALFEKRRGFALFLLSAWKSFRMAPPLF